MRTQMLAVLLMVTVAACVCDPAPDLPAWLGDCPDYAMAYTDETHVRFRKLGEGDGSRHPAWNAQGTLEATHEKTGLVFVLIPGGSFEMGSPVREKFHEFDEEQRRVAVRAILLSKTECTRRAWITGEGGDHSDPGSSDLPVEGVNWNDCQAWCGKLGLRLPTEAEWEYACRGGTTTAYWSGDAVADLARVGWSDSDDDTHVVGEKDAPNPWGLHDVHGNVWEWCEDLYESDTRERVLRGGSWFSDSEDCRSAFRYADDPDCVGHILGFRPAASLPD